MLVPRSASYYERLVGPFAEVQTFEGLADAVARHMKGLADWRTFEGYQYALLLAAQPALGAGLNTLAVPPDQLAKIYDWLIADGDVMSRAAAIDSASVDSGHAGTWSVAAAADRSGHLARSDYGAS